MKKRTHLYLIYTMIVMLALASLAFAKDESKINVSGPGGSIKIDGDKVTIGGGNGSVVNSEGKGVKANSPSSSEKAPPAGTSTSSKALEYEKDATISKKTINTDGDGIILKGDATYEIMDCNINAGKNAIVVLDNATVTMKNCTINGATSAIMIKGGGTVNASKCIINGKIAKPNKGSFINQGGNVINSF